MKNKPRILIANDDGFQAKGLRKLTDLMRQIGEVMVISTEQPMSAQSHSMTIREPLRVNLLEKDVDYVKYVCNGRPVDCVKIGYQYFMSEKPDIVVSGINHGSNASTNVVYSGTMAAVIEACMNGIPAVGFSLDCYDPDACFDHLDNYIIGFTKKVLDEGLPDGVCLNVNFPAFSEEGIKGIKICQQAKARWSEKYERRVDPFGRDYFWLTGEFIEQDSEENTDVKALNNNYVSVVPIQYDWTAYNVIDKFKTWEI
ncbi:MAG: 5'/3'-nucleotidase SurE [Bacteroidales bacterium]|nr:5'/3'-nucleotidase SurE [Bacteroidales bacterium]